MLFKAQLLCSLYYAVVANLLTIVCSLLPLRYYLNRKVNQLLSRYYIYTQMEISLTLATEMLLVVKPHPARQKNHPLLSSISKKPCIGPYRTSFHLPTIAE